MIKVISVNTNTSTYSKSYYNIETEETSEWIVLGTSAFNVVSSLVPDVNNDFQIVPTTFGLDTNTQILIEGGQKYEIGRWFEERRNVTFNVLIFNTTLKRFVKGKAFNIRQNFYTESVTVTIETGETITCSSDLPFYMHDGTWKEAKDLIVDDQLKSFFSLDTQGKLIISE